MINSYYDEYGRFIESGEGWLFIDHVCVEQPLSDEDMGYRFDDVLNGNGYYNSDGKYCGYDSFCFD